MNENPARRFWQLDSSTVVVLVAGLGLPLIMTIATLFDKPDGIETARGDAATIGAVAIGYFALVCAVASICELRSRRKERAKP